MTVTLPKGANIPSHWIRSATVEKAVIQMPSRSVPRVNYDVELNYETNELKCECQGFNFRGKCAHLAALKFATYKKKSKKKKGMADTSLESFYSFTPDDLGDRQKAVFKELTNSGPMSNKQLSNKIHWPINTITPRVKELRDMGLVDEYGTRYDANTNRREIVWEIVS